MLLQTREARLELPAGQVLCLNDAKGAWVQATRGQLWVTIDGDHRDHILAAGDRLELTADGCALVSAVAGDAAVLATIRRRPTLRAALHNFVRRLQRVVLQRHPAAELRAV